MIELTKVAVGPLAYFGIYQVFETCIYKELSAYFDWRLSKQQCGFRKGFKILKKNGGKVYTKA